MRNWLTTVGALVLVTGISMNATASESSLKRIMQDLGKQIGRMTEAMMSDDLVTVGEAAEAIADHPKPDLAERLSVLSRIGSDAAVFRSKDAAVHDAAVRVRQAAEAGNRTALAEHYHQLTTACLSCHSQFRHVFRTSDDVDVSTP